MPGTNERRYEISDADLSNLNDTQFGVETSSDAELGFNMWGGKDASGDLTRWLAKDQNAQVLDLYLKDADHGGTQLARLIHSADTDTYLEMQADYMLLMVGNVEAIKITESTDDTIVAGMNIGIRVTPESWVSTLTALQIGGNAAISSTTAQAASGRIYVTHNAYYDSVNTRWEFISTDEATMYAQLDGYHIWQNTASGTADTVITWTERMRLDANGNLGVGVVPEVWDSIYKAIQLGGNGAISSIAAQGASGSISIVHNAYYDDTDNRWEFISTDEATTYVQINGAHIWYNTVSGTADTAITWVERMRLDISGNLGIGVIPEVWDSTYKAIQLGGNGAIASTAAQGASGSIIIVHNAYYDDTDSRWEFISTDEATAYTQSSGGHSWYNTVAGLNPDDPITFTERMRLDASGNLGIGVTPSFSTHLRRYGTNAATSLMIDTYNDQAGAGFYSYLAFRKFHNDDGSTTTATLTTEELGGIFWYGANSGNTAAFGAQMRAIQDGAAGATYPPTNLLLETYSGTALNASQLVLHNDGNIGVGIDAPEGKLHVQWGSAGAVAAISASPTTLVLEASNKHWLNMLSADASESGIAWTSPASTSSAHGEIVCAYNADDPYIRFTVGRAANQNTPTYIYNDRLQMVDGYALQLCSDGSGTTASDGAKIYFDNTSDDHLYVVNQEQSGHILFHTSDPVGRFGFGITTAAPAGTVEIDQEGDASGIPVLVLNQSDTDYPFIKFVGDAASGQLAQDLVDTGDVSTATIVGYFKIEILDDGNQITDGNYYVPFYSLA